MDNVAGLAASNRSATHPWTIVLMNDIDLNRPTWWDPMLIREMGTSSNGELIEHARRFSCRICFARSGATVYQINRSSFAFATEAEWKPHMESAHGGRD